LIIAAHRQAFMTNQQDNAPPQICCPTMILLYSTKYFEASVRVTESLVCLSILMMCMRSFSLCLTYQDQAVAKKLSLLSARRGIEEASADQYHHFIWTVIMAAEASPSQTPSTLLSDLLAPTARNGLKAQAVLDDWAKLEKIMKKYSPRIR